MRVLAQLADGSSQWTAVPFQFLRKRTRFELLYFIQNFSHRYNLWVPDGLQLSRSDRVYISPFLNFYILRRPIQRRLRRRRNYDTVLNIIYYYYYLCVYRANIYIYMQIIGYNFRYRVYVCVCVYVVHALTLPPPPQGEHNVPINQHS